MLNFAIRMTLIKSISGIRGTIGGKPGQNLTPEDIIKFTAAFGTWVKPPKGINTLSLGGTRVSVGIW